jgi:primosomal protein N' (replication factor Y)
MKLGIENALEINTQVILFQNRRGYSPYQICETCGWIPQCKHCDVSLNFHKNTHKLHCHYCGATYPPVHRCQACGTDRFAQRNFGTEKIEEQLEELFPKAKIARMDVDSVKGKQAHDLLIQQFEQKRIDILVGTQMVVKGLDFENVSLVGILDADSILGFADFRVNERAFQLMEQVSGRAGRKGSRGRVLVQVSNLSHPVLQFVRKHDFPSFNYPPFSRFIRLTFKHHQKNTAEGAAQFFTQQLKSQFGRFAVGPAEPVVNRIRNQFLMELNLKLPRDASLIKNCKQQLLALVAQLHFEKRYRSVVVVIDVDAY